MIAAEQIRNLLSNPFVRWNLKRLSKRDADGKALIDQVCAVYAGQQKVKLRHLPYLVLISLFPIILKVNRAELVKIFSESNYRRSIANVAQSVAEFNLSVPQRFSSPILVVWNFTNICNLSCKHCCQNAHGALPDELILEDRLKIIDELDLNYVSALAFSGGEPLMHKDFWPVAQYAHKKGIHLSVATNGTLITKEVAARLKKTGVNYVEISVDSVKPEKHDAFRGGSGYWLRAVDGIKNCVEAGLDVGMATTVTRKNFDELDCLIALAKDLKAGAFYAFNFVPAGRGKTIVEDDLTPQMREEMLKKLHKTILEGEIMAFSTCTQFGRYCYEHAPDDVLITSHYGYFKGQQAKMLCDYIGGCGAGRLYCAIQPNGIVTPCVFMQIPVGDLRCEPLSDIWRNSKVMQQLRDRTLLKGHCVECEHRTMCGGCRARAYGYFHDYLAPDPGCIYNAKAWEELVADHETPLKEEIC